MRPTVRSPGGTKERDLRVKTAPKKGSLRITKEREKTLEACKSSIRGERAFVLHAERGPTEK